MANNTVGIYVDFESILDFRLATLSKLNDAFASTLLNEKYLDRSRDDEFYLDGGITVPQFKTAYANRVTDFKSLMARPTAIFWLLGKIITERTVNRDTPKELKPILLTINVYPFQLDDAARDTLAAAVSIYLDGEIPIEVIYDDIIDMTPKALQSRYTDLVMYDFNAWYDHHGLALMNTLMPEVVVHTPAIYRGYRLDPERVKELAPDLNHAVNPFEWTMYECSDNIDLRYVDTRFFSIELPKFPVGATA